MRKSHITKYTATEHILIVPGPNAMTTVTLRFALRCFRASRYRALRTARRQKSEQERPDIESSDPQDWLEDRHRPFNSVIGFYHSHFPKHIAQHEISRQTRDAPRNEVDAWLCASSIITLRPRWCHRNWRTSDGVRTRAVPRKHRHLQTAPDDGDATRKSLG